jgi:hypothetical protein
MNGIIRVAEKDDRFKTLLNAVRDKLDRLDDLGAFSGEQFGGDHVGDRVPCRRATFDDVQSDLLGSHGVSIAILIFTINRLTENRAHRENVVAWFHLDEAREFKPCFLLLQIGEGHVA